MKKLLPFLFILISLTACNSKYIIEGSSAISNLEGKTLFMKVLQGDNWMAIDSSEIVHGNFIMKGRADSIVMTSLFVDDQNLMPLILENGKIKVVLSYAEISARGTEMNDILFDFLDKKDQLERNMYDLERQEARLVLDGRDIDEIRRELSTEGEKLVAEMDSMVKKVIIDNADNVLGPYVFVLLGSSLPYPLLTPQIEDILKDAPYSLKSNDMVKEYINKAKENMELIRERQRMEYGGSTNRK